jgi:hypothetical protein
MKNIFEILYFIDGCKQTPSPFGHSPFRGEFFSKRTMTQQYVPKWN